MVIGRRKILYVVLGLLALGTSARADLSSVSVPPVESSPSMLASVANSPQDADSSHPLDCLGTADLGPLPVESLPRLPEGGEGARGPVVPRIQSDGQSSFGLCLYALLGLGVCRSVPLVKRFSLVQIPQWYHDGGPFQIGHSHAISPDCLCDAPVYCFVQPDSIAPNPIPRYHFRAVVSRWRDSQFTPAVLASRAPPFSC